MRSSSASRSSLSRFSAHVPDVPPHHRTRPRATAEAAPRPRARNASSPRVASGEMPGRRRHCCLICRNFGLTALGTINAGEAEHGSGSSLGTGNLSNAENRIHAARRPSVVCLFVVVGLVVLGSMLTLPVWTTAALPPRKLDSCPEFDLCAAPVADGNESLWVDDPRADELRMSR